MLTEPRERASDYHRVRRLVYISTSRIGGDLTELDRLVEHSSLRNTEAGITGILWFDGVKFVQVLEGDHDVINSTIDRIIIDTRHTDINVIVDREVTTRMFGNWAMRHADAEADCIEGTAFLVGYIGRESPKLAREIVEIISASGG